MGGAGLVVLVLLFAASVVYVLFGGAFAETWALDVDTSTKVLVADPAKVGSVPLKEKISGKSAEVTDYFPAAYPKRGRDGDGNVKTYEHD